MQTLLTDIASKSTINSSNGYATRIAGASLSSNSSLMHKLLSPELLWMTFLLAFLIVSNETHGSTLVSSNYKISIMQRTNLFGVPLQRMKRVKWVIPTGNSQF